jgi:hypothetical protein
MGFKPFSEQERIVIASRILELKGTNAKPPYGYTKDIAKQLNVSSRTVRRVWQNMHAQIKQGHDPMDRLAPNLSSRGRKRSILTPEFSEKMKAVPKKQRLTVRIASKFFFFYIYTFVHIQCWFEHNNNSQVH